MKKSSETLVAHEPVDATLGRESSPASCEKPMSGIAERRKAFWRKDAPLVAGMITFGLGLEWLAWTYLMWPPNPITTAVAVVVPLMLGGLSWPRK